jgi:hypothetical protein
VSSAVFVYASLAVTAGLGLVLFRMARALSRVGDALAAATADRPAPGRHHRGGGGPGPARRRSGQPDGNAWDDGYRVPAGHPDRLWKPERRPRGTAVRALRAVFTFGAALAVWYATGFSMTPFAGAGCVLAFIAATWLTRRRKGRVNPGA